MSIFSQLVAQPGQIDVYYPGANTCKPGTCSASTPVAKCTGCDWHYTDVTCAPGCPSQPACSVLYADTCPSLGTSFISAQWAKSDTGVCLTPQVSCTYDASKMTYDDILAYKTQFCDDSQCTNSESYSTVIMPTFCLSSSKTCTGGLTSCTEMLDSTDSGSLCRSWASTYPTEADTAISEFCRLTPDSTCSCVSRYQSDAYVYLNTNLEGKYNPGCWFTSCTNPQKQLITSDVVTKGCDKATMCADINNIVKTVPTTLSKGQIQAATICTITEDPIAPDNTSGTSSTSSSTVFWVIIAIIIFLFLIIFMLFLLSK